MDSLTQVVLGSAVGEKVLGKKIGNRALLYGAIIGTIPDLDVLVGKFLDPITAIEIHRGFSHSLLFFILFSPIFGWFIFQFEKKKISYFSAVQLSFWCLFTHSILDAFTTWGTQIFWPLPYEFAFKSIFVIDPLYTLPFIFCLIMVMRRNKNDKKRRKWNNAGLTISTSYLFLTLVLKFFAFEKFENALDQQNIAYKDIIVKPSPLNTILWKANVETEDHFLIGDYSFFDTEPISFDSYPKNHELAAAIANSETLERLIAISEGWYSISKENNNLYFNDLRFGMLNPHEENPKYVFSYRLIQNGNSITIEEVEKSREEGFKLLENLLNRISGN